MLMMFQELMQAVIEGDALLARKATQETLAKVGDVKLILNGALVPAMRAVGDKMKSGEFFLPEVMLAGRAMQAAMEEIRPSLVGIAENSSIVVLGSVKGDMHDIGKNIVKMMLEGAGFKVVDLGIDVPAEKFIKAIRDHEAAVLALSALLTITMKQMPYVIELLKEELLREQVKVIIGGACVTQNFADSIGADGYAATAAEAVSVVTNFFRKEG